MTQKSGGENERKDIQEDHRVAIGATKIFSELARNRKQKPS